jgi:hypothetical protein
MKFSERYGHVPVRSVLQTENMDAGLRNRLWNLVCSTFFSTAPKVPSVGNYLPNFSQEYALIQNVWHNYFKQTTDSIGISYDGALTRVRDYFMSAAWYSAYDLIEFLANSISESSYRESFVNSVNHVLKEELAGYRFVSGRLVQITSQEEIVSIEQALALPDPLKAVTAHLRQALALLGDKKTPDYRNSIKESISAIESLSKILSGQPKTTLGPALDVLEKRSKLHPSLKEAFQKLYGYTSDAQGIRHALLDEYTLDMEDATFMLVAWSAFVNYIVVKAQKAGIKV